MVVGAGGFGHELKAFILSETDLSFRGFLDDASSDPSVISTLNAFSPGLSPDLLYLAIGDGLTRLSILDFLVDRGLCASTYSSPRVISAEGPDVLRLSLGSVFLGGCSISTRVSLGKALLVQGYAVIGHDVTVSDGVTLGSFSFLGGGSSVGVGSVVHPHAVILPGVKVGSCCVVGAGSVVLRNVPDGATVYGNPAKKLA